MRRVSMFALVASVFLFVAPTISQAQSTIDEIK